MRDLKNSLVSLEVEKVEINGIFWLALASLVALLLLPDKPLKKRFNRLRRFRARR